MTECINCQDSSGGKYTLVLSTGVLLQDRPLCTTCHAFFKASEHVEVHTAPVMLRGGVGDDDNQQGAEELKRL